MCAFLVREDVSRLRRQLMLVNRVKIAFLFRREIRDSR
jgi:hypothetical protein